MTIIIHLGTGYSSIDGVYARTEEANKIIYPALKEGKAKLKIDTEETRMYEIIK